MADNERQQFDSILNRMLTEALQRLTRIEQQVDGIMKGQEIIRQIAMQHDRWIAGHEQGTSVGAGQDLDQKMQLQSVDHRTDKIAIALVAVTILCLLNTLALMVMLFKR